MGVGLVEVPQYYITLSITGFILTLSDYYLWEYLTKKNWLYEMKPTSKDGMIDRTPTVMHSRIRKCVLTVLF